MSHDQGQSRTMRSGPSDVGTSSPRADGRTPLPREYAPTPEEVADRVKRHTDAEFEAGVADGMMERMPQKHSHHMGISMPADPKAEMLQHPLWVPFSIWFSTRMIHQANPVERMKLSTSTEALFDAFTHGHSCALDNE